MIFPQSNPSPSIFKPNSVGAMRQGVIELGVLEQRLGGNATPVEAGAAGAILFHAGDLLAKLRRANRADISGGSAADDNQIIIGHNIISVCPRMNRILPQEQ